MKAKKGFTLVEILIVVVILGILAAIVIPQFTNASQEAKLSALKSNLQTVRAQIQLYKIQHNDSPPAVATFENDMTVIDANGFGPYLERVPNNPFTNDNTVGAWDAGTSWELNATTGAFRAGDGGTTLGEAHADL
jgi:general secretion pathway protein G